MTPVPETQRRAELRRMQRRATALLVAVAGVFPVLLVVPEGDPVWLGYALAAAEGSMVGGLADWFAVTALFRHPLGLPIPHTAIIRERKDQFGETLGTFVQENFLNATVVGERLRAQRVGERVADWLATPQNADRVAAGALDALVAAVDLVGDDDIHRLLHGEVERAVRAMPAAPLAGRALRELVSEGRHQPFVDAVASGGARFLDEQRVALWVRFAKSSPWWLPMSVQERLFDRLIDGGRELLDAMAADPSHELRVQLDARLVELAWRLEHEPAMALRARAFVDELLASAELRAWTRSLWTDLSATLRRQADDPRSVTRERLAGAVVTMGGRLRSDAALQARLTRAAEAAVDHVTTRHRDEIAGLISATIARWDAEETSDKLELLLGRDLQFIRINGTVVGGLAGLLIHAVAVAAG